MEKLIDETYLEDNGVVSRNIWYGYIEFYKDAGHGMEITFDENLINTINRIIKSDLSEDTKPPPTVTHWYLYGKTVARDAVKGTVRPNIMIREKRVYI